MRPRTARILLNSIRAAVIALAPLSAGMSTWYVTSQPLPYDLHASQVSARVDDCKGSFSSRYDCKSSILIDRDNRLFYLWLSRLGIIAGPLLFVYIGYRLATRRLEDEANPPIRRPRSAAG